MAFPSVTTASPANIFPAGFQAVFIKDSGGKWQTLGGISNGVLNIKDFSVLNSIGQNKAQGASDFTAKCNMLQASLTELELLDTICNGTNDFLFKLADAAAIPTGGAAATTGWVTVTSSRVGVKAKVVADGDPSNDMHIELEFQGSILLSEKDATVKASIDDDEFASSADSATATFYAIGTYTAAKDGGKPANSHIKPCGVSTLTLADVAGGGAVTMSPITNVKMSYEMLAVTDSLRRFLPKSMDINIEWDWLATDAADLLLLDAAMVSLDVNAVITMLNGVIFTLTNQVGIETNFEITGDMDAARVVRFTHKGKVLQSSFDGIVST